MLRRSFSLGAAPVGVCPQPEAVLAVVATIHQKIATVRVLRGECEKTRDAAWDVYAGIERLQRSGSDCGQEFVRTYYEAVCAIDCVLDVCAAKYPWRAIIYAYRYRNELEEAGERISRATAKLCESLGVTVARMKQQIEAMAKQVKGSKPTAALSAKARMTTTEAGILINRASNDDAANKKQAIDLRDMARANELVAVCREGSLAHARRVLKAGADPTGRDGSPQRKLAPIHFAALEGHARIVKLLVEKYRVDPAVRDDNDRTPLHHAAGRGHLDVVIYLVTMRKVDPSEKDGQGNTALLRAAHAGHLDIVEYLVALRKVDPDEQDGQGNTALVRAAHAGHRHVVAWLSCRCTLDAKNSLGRSAVDEAKRKGHTAIAKDLARMGEYTKTIRGA
ncbi:hypothetical protein CTAYLR_008980 [Chrysophaeum taylorii]|uniref:Ankyrin repeat protein n=1 Tax=Chrysophaeum taylorii TaxID=2483200 RepID=A0AAD7UAX3_9STRA|nr:hypothetical protein CTAYLR_008980 [Chrysophaeum taylorii]